MKHLQIHKLLLLIAALTLLILIRPIQLTLAATSTITPAVDLTQTQQENQGTLSATQTIEPSQTLTPTTTLAPLPVITLIFPAHTATPTKTINPSILTASPTNESGIKDNTIDSPPRIKLLTVMIVLLWLTLAGFLLLFLRQII